jgi:hypothetical protein
MMIASYFGLKLEAVSSPLPLRRQPACEGVGIMRAHHYLSRINRPIFTLVRGDFEGLRH